MKKINKILVIIQRSNGDVFLSSPLLKKLYDYYECPEIDLLINDDTKAIARLIPNVRKVHTFSYEEKNKNRWRQELNIILTIFQKYDLSINLTASDRSVFYSLLAARNSISAVESNKIKSWWKKLFLTNYYYFDDTKHILKNNLESLKILKISSEYHHHPLNISGEVISDIKKRLRALKIKEFLIFHPSAQYEYKIYPKSLREILLKKLDKLEISILITGGDSLIDENIKNELPTFQNIHNFIGKTSLEEFFALSHLSLGYVGMDTLNMHIAASQNKRIFAIFGPTNLKMWSPWSNTLQVAATENKPIQTYQNITLFQGYMPCVACGKAGCNDNHVSSDCLDNINPNDVVFEINNWLQKKEKNNSNLIPIETIKNGRRIILYVVYGEDLTYYEGAIFSFLSAMHWFKKSEKIEVIVLTEKPFYFENYPINTLLMTQEQINEWSLDGRYHFRIKNRGLAYAIEKLQLNNFDKILFFDTDTYFHKSPLPLFDLIQPYQAVLYLNEGLIYKRKRFSIYVENLANKEIKIESEYYKISKKTALWGSLMIGVMPNMLSSVHWADKLILKLLDLVDIHTIEEFALAESLLKKYKLVEGRKYVSLYSTSRKKEYAREILKIFFRESNGLSIDEKIHKTQTTKIKRPINVVFKQRLTGKY